MDKVQKIREEIEKIKTVHSSVSLKKSNPDILVTQVCTNLLSFIDSLQEEPVSKEWIEELTTKLDSMSKEDFKKVFDKYAIDFKEEPISEELEETSRNYADTIDAQCFGFQGAALFSFRLPADNYIVGSKVKVIVIKKD